MSNEFDVDWDNDDFFSGDIDFDDDFEFDPYKGKGFFSSFGTGLLRGVTDSTIGSTDAIIRTSRILLPKSFTNFLDKTTFLKDRVSELADEFKENNYRSVVSLQNIAKSIAEKNKLGFGNGALGSFAEKDFSDWEGYQYNNSGDVVKGLEGVSDDEVNSQINTLLSSQSQAFQNAANGINEMQTHIAGQQIAALKTGNRELINIQSGIRDLLDYNRRIQYKMDQTKIELMSRSYLVNVKFYKFMESSMHASIREMKRITEQATKSEFEKTQEYNKKHRSTLGSLANFAGKRAGGLIGQLSKTFGRESRLNAYSTAGGLLSSIEDMFSLTGDMKISKGFVGEQMGSIFSSILMRELPYLLNQSPFQRKIDGMFKNSSFGSLSDIGNILSGNANNGLGLLNQLAEGWQDLEENPYNSYQDYVTAQRKAGKRALPERYYKMVYGTLGEMKGGINRYMSSVTKSRGTQYHIDQRNSASLTEVSQWREINNITLNDVIPGWLSRIYESLEKTRTGNDNFTSPVFSYNRGQFVNKENAQKIVRNDIFDHSRFRSAGEQVNKIVNSIDTEGLLTDDQRRQLALRIARDVDKGNGFNPYAYSGSIEGFDPQLERMVNGVIRRRFNISDEQQAAYNNARGVDRLKIAATQYRGEAAEQFNEITSLASALKETIPDIGANLHSARQSGNENLLREMGLIYTKDGVDQFNMDAFWERMQEYIADPSNPELRGDLRVSQEENAGGTRGALTYTPSRQTQQPIKAGESQKQFNELVNKLNQSIENLGQNIALMQTEKPDSVISNLPDKFDALTAITQQMNERGDAHTKLLEKISDCVCRQAGGWGGKSTLEKEKIKREEANAKKSIMGYIRNISPKGVINRGLEILANNQPLVLGGLLGGLGTLAFKDPKAAAFVGAGIGIATLYTKIGDFARGEMPSDDEDILDETGTVILHSAKLRQNYYYDTAKKKVIKSWNDIGGAIYDLGSKTYVTVAQLTGKIFGPDGRALIIKGLSKVRDTLNGIWNKLDLVNNAQKLFNKGKEQFYQQDVYVKGQSEPKLTRSGFIAKKYFCLNPSTKEPESISGWNEIKGPVYELDNDGNLNQIVTELEFSQGLITSSGVALDKLGKIANFAGKGALSGLFKARDYALDKAGYVQKKYQDVKDSIIGSGVETRLDKIYYLLCSQFGVTPTDESIPTDDTPSTNDESHHDATPMSPAQQVKAYRRRAANTLKGMRQQGTESEYPNKIRLNSLEDKEQKARQKKQDQLYDDIHAMREDMDASTGKSSEDKKGKGIFGKLSGMLFGGLEMAKMLFTNPIGFMAKIATGTVTFLFKSLFNSSERLVKLGGLLFKGVLGAGSGIYKLLQWGFNGVMAAITRLGIGKLRGYPVGGDDLPDDNDDDDDDYDYDDDDRSRRKKKPKEKTKKDPKGKTKRTPKDKTKKPPKRKTKKVPKGRGKRQIASTILNMFTLGALGGSDDESDFDADTVDRTFTRQSERAGAKQAEKKAVKMGGESVAKMFSNGLSLSRRIPWIGALFGAYDAYKAFDDDEELHQIFGDGQITARQRWSNGVTGFLDMGGLVSASANKLSDLTGIDALRQEGGVTRFIEKQAGVLEKSLDINMPLIAFAMFTSGNKQSVQQKLRYAMYGLEKIDNALGNAIYKAEKMLEPSVVFDKTNGNVTFDAKAPTEDAERLFCQHNPKEGHEWYKGRFEPVYKLWQSALRVVGFASMEDFDKSNSGKVYSVANQVKSALGILHPYPLDVVSNVDSATAIMSRQASEGRINEYLKQLEKKVGKDAASAEKLTLGKETVKLKTQSQINDPVMAAAPGDVTNIMHRLNDTLTYKTDELLFKTPKSVFDIDISDLHKDDKTPIDELTLVRLGAYGNTDNDSVRVDTVLKLERYCEQFMVYQGGKAGFAGKLSDIFALFSNAFRVNEYWKPVWVEWFNKRFIPVLTVWYEQVYMLRNAPPKATWRSLSKTNKYVIAQALMDVKVKDGKEDIAAWNIDASPFTLTKSGTESERVSVYLTNLENASVTAKLKTPELEAQQSQPIDRSTKPQPLTQQQENDFYAKASGGIRIGGGALSNTVAPFIPSADTTVAPPPGSDAVPFFAGEAGNYSGTPDTNFSPSSLTQGAKGFKISETEAIKTILNEFVKAGITDNRMLAFALANAKAETDFQGSAENMNYPAERLVEIFKSTFGRNPSLAYKLGRVGSKPADQKAIANVAYGQKYGNKGGDDGWNYRGRGYTQLTFKNNYKAVADAIGDQSIVSNPEKLSTDPVAAADSAVGFFKINPRIGQYIQQGRIYDAAKVVGQHEAGARKKVGYYSDFLKRLTEGDLKGILDQKKDTQEEKEEEGTSVPVPSMSDATATDPSAQAAEKVNAPPPPAPVETAETATSSSSDSAPMGGGQSPSAPVEPSTPEVTDTQPLTPSRQPVPPSSPVQPTEVKFPEGVVNVRDEGVVNAIAALAQALNRVLTPPANTPDKRVGVARR